MIRAALLASTMLATSAHAAVITVTRPDSVMLRGTIDPQDGSLFHKVTAGLPNGARVQLDSAGGDMLAGLAIGEEVVRRSFQTVVPANTVCASMCGLIWVAGSTRWASVTSHIGFHSIKVITTGEVNAPGNALVGAYLSKLGYSAGAIAYFTYALPSSMMWLTSGDAKRIGLTYKYLDTPDGRVPMEAFRREFDNDPAACERAGGKQTWVSTHWECLEIGQRETQWTPARTPGSLDGPVLDPSCNCDLRKDRTLDGRPKGPSF